MSDIVERLRNYAKDWRDKAASKEIVEEAADEIEQLREALQQIERYASDGHVKRRARAALSAHKPVIT